MASNVCDFSELDDFAKNIMNFASKDMPKDSKKFLNKEGVSLRKVTASVAKQKVKKGKDKTNKKSYHKNIKKGKVYKWQGNVLAVRVYGASPHAHLIEYGHRQVVNGKEVGFVEGRHVFETAYNQFQNQYYKDCEDFAEDILRELSK